MSWYRVRSVAVFPSLIVWLIAMIAVVNIQPSAEIDLQSDLAINNRSTPVTNPFFIHLPVILTQWDGVRFSNKWTPSLRLHWTWNSPGRVKAPILLYHHIRDVDQSDRYSVSPKDFHHQMECLDAWGYTPITMSLLLKALLDGAFFPQKPIVLTFDDGYFDVYQNAYPILKEMG